MFAVTPFEIIDIASIKKWEKIKQYTFYTSFQQTVTDRSNYIPNTERSAFLRDVKLSRVGKILFQV